jgi:hypothetical protein
MNDRPQAKVVSLPPYESQDGGFAPPLFVG